MRALSAPSGRPPFGAACGMSADNRLLAEDLSQATGETGGFMKSGFLSRPSLSTTESASCWDLRISTSLETSVSVSAFWGAGDGWSEANFARLLSSRIDVWAV